jgi:hypothetical protein
LYLYEHVHEHTRFRYIIYERAHEYAGFISFHIVPTHSVQNLTASNRSSTSLALHWSRLSSQPSQSAILGYAVIYEQLPWPGNVRSNELTRIAVFLNTTRGRLAQLQKYSWYRLRISGMNRRGVGIPSDPLIVLTDEDGKSSNLFPLSAIFFQCFFVSMRSSEAKSTAETGHSSRSEFIPV